MMSGDRAIYLGTVYTAAPPLKDWDLTTAICEMRSLIVWQTLGRNSCIAAGSGP